MAGLALLFLAWFVIQPQVLLRPGAGSQSTGEPSLASTEPPVSTPNKNPDNRRLTAAPQNPVDAAMETGSGKEVPGEKVVRFTFAEAYRKFLAMAPPGTVLGRIDPLNSARIKNGAWLADALAQTGGSASGNFYVRVPEVPLEVREKGNDLYQAVGKKALDLMGAGNVAETWGRGVKIALMDTPVGDGEKVEGETAGHGTAMRSLIQGQNGSARGAAPGAELLAFPVLGQDGKGNSFDLANAILKATDQGARVINMSLGAEGDSPVVRDAVAYALARNVVLVAAAGNEAVNRVNYPAAYEGVMAVASVDAKGNHLYFSNRGNSIDLAAPGFAVTASWPGDKVAEVTGTSASSALVAGAVAALLSREPGLSGKQAMELLGKYADATGLPGSSDEIGGGVINFQRVLSRNQRGIVDLAVGGVTMREEGSRGQILVGVQNRGTETVNSPSLEITVGGDHKKYYFGPLAPNNTFTQEMAFDLTRARQDGGIATAAVVHVSGDQQGGNDSWAGYFRISK